MNTKKLSLVNASTLIASRLSVCLFFVSKHHLQQESSNFFYLYYNLVMWKSLETSRVLS